MKLTAKLTYDELESLIKDKFIYSKIKDFVYIDWFIKEDPYNDFSDRSIEFYTDNMEIFKLINEYEREIIKNSV